MSKFLNWLKTAWSNNLLSEGGRHFIVSIIKSLIRLAGALIAILIAPTNLFYSMIILAFSLFVAEMLGVLEELMDRR